MQRRGRRPSLPTVDLIRKKGRICVIGLTGKDTIPFPWDKAAFKVCDVIFNLSTSYTSWDRTIHLIASGRLPAGEVITGRCLCSSGRTPSTASRRSRH